MRGIIPTLWVCSAVLVAFPAWRPMPTYGSGKILTVQGLMPRRVSGGLDPELTIAAMRAVHANALILDLGYEQQWQDVLNFLPVGGKFINRY